MTRKTTNVSYSPHPLLPAANRQTYDIPLKDKTLQALLDALPYETHRLDVFAFVNDEIVPRTEWGTHELKETDVVTLKQRLHGGGDSNPLQIIAVLALIVLTIYAPGMAGMTTQLASGATVVTKAGMVLQATIMVAGSVLINAIFPPVLPNFGGDDAGNNYSITGGRNNARRYQPLPLIVGTHKVHPDLGAQPFTTQRGEDAYLHQIFNFGFGDLTITDLKIGDTVIESHQDITTEWSDANGKLSLFPTNVDSLAGGTIKHEDGWMVRTTSNNTTMMTVDLNGILVKTDTEGKFRTDDWYYQIQYREVGDEVWIGWDTSNSLQKLVYDIDYESGESLISHKGSKPVRRSFTKTVLEGQYEVRVRQSRPLPTLKNWSRTAEMAWSQLRSHQPDTSSYANQTRLAVEVRASGQFNGALDTVNAIVSANIPTWNGSTWVSAPSNNPAYIYLYLARGATDSNGKRLWGANLPDSRIDIDGIKEWADWCDDKGLECNFIFDRKMTIADMLALVARTGRASPTWQKGILGVVYDRESLPITQVFGMANIIQGSFNVQYLTENLADEIVVKFVNKDLDYQPDEVRVPVPNVTTPGNPAEVEIAGVTSVAQAGKEANLLAARQYYNRRRVSFETDIEGLVCARGDVISVSHDLTDWAVSGRLESGTTTVLNLSREVTFQPSTNYWCGVRYPDGEYVIRAVTNPSTGTAVTTKTITLASALPASPNADEFNHPRDYLFFFDPKATPGKKFKVTSVSPQGENRVAIAAVDEVDAYYAAESGEFAYVPPERFNQSKSQITNVQVTEEYQGYGLPLRMYLTWDLTQALGAKIRVRVNNGTWNELAEVRGSSYTYDVIDWNENDQFDYELTPIATAAVRESILITAVTYFVQGLPGVVGNINVPSPTGLELFGQALGNTFTGRDAKFTWRRVSFEGVEFGSESLGAEEGTWDTIFEDYEIRIYDSNGLLRRTDHTSIEEYTYTYEKNVEDGNGVAARAFTIAVYIRTTTNQIGLPALLTVSNPAPAAPSNIKIETLQKTININVDQPQDVDHQGMIVWASATTSFTPGPSNQIYKGVGTAASIITTFEYDVPTYLRIALYDGFDTTGLNVSDQIEVTLSGISIDEIADGAINSTAMFAQSIRPIEVVDTLPVTGLFVGRQVFLTTDGKVYRYYDSEWTSAIDAGDVEGAILATELADGSVGIEAFAGGLEPVSVVSSIPVEKVTEVIFNTTDGRIYRWNGDEYVGSFSTTQLEGVIEAEQIADGAIDPTKLASGISAIETVAALPSLDNYEGRVVYLTTDNKLYRHTGTPLDASGWTAAVPTTDLSGVITSDQVEDLVASKITGQLTDAQLGAIAASKVTGQLSDTQLAAISAAKVTGQITGTQIADDAITTAKLAAGAVTANEIAANTITAAEIAALTITASQIAGETITGNKIVGNTITASQIASETITANEIATNAITAAKILAGAITTDKMTANSIHGDRISAGTLNASKIVADSITSGQIAANAITATEIAANAVTAAKILAGTITANEIAANTITADNIASNTITAGQIAAGTISADELAANSVTAVKILAGAVTTDKMTANSIHGDRISAGTLNADKITSNSITAGQIQAGAIGTTELAANSIIASKMAIGDFRGLVPNSTFKGGEWLDWGTTTSWSIVPKASAYTGDGPTAYVVEALGGVSARGIYATTDYFDAKPGDTFRLSIDAVRDAGTFTNSTFRVIIYWLYKDGSTGLWSWYLNPTTSWQTFTTNSAAAPANTVGARLRVYRNDSTSNTSKIYFTNVQARKRDAGELIVDGAITASQINVGSLAAFEVTTGTLYNRATGAGSTPLLKISNTNSPLTIFDLDGATELMNVSVTGGAAKLALTGEFNGSLTAGSITSASHYSPDGLADLRDKLGLSQPSGGAEQTGGMIQRNPVPAAIASGGTIAANYETAFFKTGGATITLNARLTDAEDYFSAAGPSTYSAPVWTLKFQYSVNGTNWYDVPNSSQQFTGSAWNTTEDTIPVSYSGSFSIDATITKTTDTTAMINASVGNNVYFRVHATRDGGSQSSPQIRAMTASEPLNNAGTVPTHSHDASDITSGVLNVSRLGTGTANSSTYLRGDGTWASVPASGGTVTSVTAGNGMSFTTITGSGAVTMGTPSSCSPATSNATTSTSHTHTITGVEPTLAANRKRQIFVQSTTPSGQATGDLWIW